MPSANETANCSTNSNASCARSERNCTATDGGARSAEGVWRMYNLLGLCLALAALLCTNVLATFVSVALWRALPCRFRPGTPAAQAQALLYLRLLPFARAAGR